MLALKNDILSGRFGAPIRLGILHGYRRGADYYRRNDWAGRIAVNGREVWDSPFSNASAHNFQMMAFLLGNALHTACGITGVQAELYRGNPLVENFDIAALRFSTDCGAELMYFTAHPIEPDELGPRGILEFEKGTITLGPEHPSFRAKMRDGTCVDYARIDPGPPLQKLVDALSAGWKRIFPISQPSAWFSSSPSSPCGILCAFPMRLRARLTFASTASKPFLSSA